MYTGIHIRTPGIKSWKRPLYATLMKLYSPLRQNTIEFDKTVPVIQKPAEITFRGFLLTTTALAWITIPLMFRIKFLM